MDDLAANVVGMVCEERRRAELVRAAGEVVGGAENIICNFPP